MADNSIERSDGGRNSLDPNSMQETHQEGSNASIRQYLDQTVAPLLIQAMSEVAKERPDRPIEYIIKFLRDNNPNNRNAAASPNGADQLSANNPTRLSNNSKLTANQSTGKQSAGSKKM